MDPKVRASGTTIHFDVAFIGNERSMSPATLIAEIKRLYLDGHKPKQIKSLLGLSEPFFRRAMFRMRAQITLADYCFSPQVRRDIANSTLMKTIIENADSEDPRKQTLALRAASKVLSDLQRTR